MPMSTNKNADNSCSPFKKNSLCNAERHHLRNTTPSEMWGVIMFAIKISSQSGDLLAIARTRRQRSQTHIYRSPLSLRACPVLQDCCKHMVMIRYQCILHYSRKVLEENMTENSALEKNTFNMLFHLQPPSAKAWPFWRTAEITQSTSSSLRATAASLFFCKKQTVMSQQIQADPFPTDAKTTWTSHTKRSRE